MLTRTPRQRIFLHVHDLVPERFFLEVGSGGDHLSLHVRGDEAALRIKLIPHLSRVARRNDGHDDYRNYYKSATEASDGLFLEPCLSLPLFLFSFLGGHSDFADSVVF